MMHSDTLQHKIVEALGMNVSSLTPLSGGDIAAAYRVKMEDGRTLFAKTGGTAGPMFLKEANGLKELEKSGAIRIPGVWYAGEGLLVLEMIAPSQPRPKDFFTRFGRALARMHRTQSGAFGFYEDNYIGATAQRNTPQLPFDPAAKEQVLWAHFFFEYRILHQYKLLESKRYAADIKSLFKKIEPLLLTIIAQCPPEPPTLLHGDLWSGNYLADEKGEPCLIDPAVYYGDREADLAMTSLFGGFPAEFYRAYHEEYPLRDEYKKREPLYQLYHVMNHVNLFGGAYWDEMRSIMRDYQ